MNDERPLSPTEKISLGLSKGQSTHTKSCVLTSTGGLAFQEKDAEKISQGIKANEAELAAAEAKRIEQQNAAAEDKRQIEMRNQEVRDEYWRKQKSVQAGAQSIP